MSMNIFKLGVWGCLILLSLNIYGQEKLTLHRELKWNDPVQINEGDKERVLFNFSGMDGVDENTDLPTYYESISLPVNVDKNSVSVVIENKDYVWPLPEEFLGYKDHLFLDDINYNVTYSHSGNQYYADLTLTPFIKEPQSACFQKLKSYDIVINYKLNANTNLKSVKVSSNDYAVNSVLSAGTWKKIRVDNTGIYKITYSKLKDWGITNPANVGIYGNGGKLLPQENSEYREDDLVENAVWHNDNAVYFFAEGPVVWDYDYSKGMYMHEKHPYSDYSYYYITEKEEGSKSIESSSIQSDSYDSVVNEFIDYDYHEENDLNLISSGCKWLGEKFEYYGDPSQTFLFNFPNIDIDEQGKIFIALASRSATSATFKISCDDTEIGSRTISSITTSDHLGYFAREGVLNLNYTPVDEDVDVTINYNNSTSSIGYLDYISINAYRNLIFDEDELLFRYVNPNQIEENLQFNIQATSGSLEVWDVSNPLIPLNVNTDYSNSDLSFNYTTSAAKEFVAFDPDGTFPSPELVGSVENQNLHGLDNVDFIIVCYPEFKDEAVRLGEIHKEYNGTTYCVATTDQVYNEFSSGKPDVTAIRSFAKMFYDRAGSDESLMPKNLLLFGDGSYDNRPGSEYSKVITFQSENSIHQTNSYVTDDYFGLLDDDEGSAITSEKIDIGIGRFPVNTLEEAENAVDKSYRYLYNQSKDSWKSKVTFVGDDGDSNIHMEDANKLAEKVNLLYPKFEINKIFFDAYEQVQSSTGAKYPDVEDEIEKAIDEGTLIFNYTGHGSPDVLSSEKVVNKGKIEAWQNYNKLPVFVTATCEFSRYDDHEASSAGELIFTHDLGGGIALYTTTRIVYSSLNFKVNNSFYDNVFELDDNGEPMTLGEIMKLTKHNSGTSVNKLNFTLLGDPALQLAFPKYNVSTLELNGVSVENDLDSLKALSKNVIKGDITDGLGNVQTDFNGEIYISIFDKRALISTLDNTDQGVFQFESYTSKVFSGKSEVVNGEFECEFIVPKDIRYNYDNGKISYYASSDDSREAFGAFDDVIVGGFSDNADDDTEGPEIELYVNDGDGKNVGPTPVLYIDLYDESGINTTGNGIGHDITCVLDGDNSNPIVLNSYYDPELNNFKKGSITYQLDQLESGEHEVTIKAWDIYNNSSSVTTTFNIEEGKSLVTDHSKVYPNPVTKGGTAYFYFEHDDPNSVLDLTINVYTKSGSLISQQEESVVSLNNTISPIEWTADVNPGMYIYEIVINSETGRSGKVSGKIIVLP